MEIHRSQRGFVWMVRKNARHHKKMHTKCVGRSQSTDEVLATILVNIKAALNSRPIIQNTEEALSPAHFLSGEKRKAIISGTEPQIERNPAKAHQWTQKLSNDFGNAGNKDNS